MSAEQPRCENCISWRRLKENAVIGLCRAESDGCRFMNERSACARFAAYSGSLLKEGRRHLEAAKGFLTPFCFLGLHLGDFA